jgi:hypothetical protein
MIAILSGFPRREGAEGAEQNHTFLSLRVLSTLCASDSGRFQTARGAEGFCPCTQTPGFLEDKCCVPQLLLYVGGVAGKGWMFIDIGRFAESQEPVSARATPQKWPFMQAYAPLCRKKGAYAGLCTLVHHKKRAGRFARTQIEEKSMAAITIKSGSVAVENRALGFDYLRLFAPICGLN